MPGAGNHNLQDFVTILHQGLTRRFRDLGEMILPGTRVTREYWYVHNLSSGCP